MMKGSSTQLLQLGVRSVEGHTQRMASKANGKKGLDTSCVFPNVMLSICNGSPEAPKPDKTDGKVLLSLCGKQVTAEKHNDIANDLLLSSDIVMSRLTKEELSNQANCVETKHSGGQKQSKTRTAEPAGQSGVKSTSDIKHPALNVPLNNHFGWNIADAKLAPSESSRIGSHHYIGNNLAALRGVKPNVVVQNDGMKFPMMWFEAKFWAGMDKTFLEPEILPNRTWSRYDALMKSYGNINTDRITSNASGAVVNQIPDTNVGDMALTMKESELPQNLIANKQRMQNPASNSNTEPAQSNGREMVNIAPSLENAKPIKEVAGASENRKPVLKTSSVIGEDDKNVVKAKNRALPQQNGNVNAKGGEISEISMNSKQAAKRQISGNPDVVKAVEEGAKSKIGARIEGVASPVSSISSSNGQATPVNNVTAPSQSRWDNLMQFVQRIMQNAQIQHRQEGLSELRVRMASETLGKLTVHVSVIDNHVDVRFALDTLQARQVMQSHKAELTQILKDTGASSVNIDVTTSSTDGEERFRQFSETGDRYSHPNFNEGLAIDDNWGYTEGLDQESELASQVTRVNRPYEHSSMVWVA